MIGLQTQTGLEQRAVEAAELAAKSAEFSANLTVYAVGLSALGLLALIGTIFQSFKALEKAREANDIARETSQDQLRSYLMFDGLGFDWSTQTAPQEQMLRLWANFKNAGVTPAQNAQFHLAIESAADPSFFETCETLESSSSSVVGPGRDITSPHVPIDATEVSRYFHGQKECFFHIRVRYDDKFRSSHETRVLLRLKFLKSEEASAVTRVEWEFFDHQSRTT